MVVQSDKSNQLDEIKTQFRAREGYYRLMSSPDYGHNSQRAVLVYNAPSQQPQVTSGPGTDHIEKTCTRVSMVTTDERNDPIVGVRQQTSNSSLAIRQHHRTGHRARDRKLCLNIGRELYVYNYDGIKTGPDTSNPIYKGTYKGFQPTCHDFNRATATPDKLSLLVGFSKGQIQLIDLNDNQASQDNYREFNSDRSIDKSRVTCIRWLPNSPSLFLVSHASGQLYLYKDDLTCGITPPIYQIYKQSDEVIVCTCKSKTTRNPIYRWSVGSQTADATASNLGGSTVSLHSIQNESCAINEFAFSPCTKYLACASQDGFLRVFCYDTSELIGRARSYYGGLMCVCWSPDGKYVVTGGEDDLVTVWSFVERRVVARGVGHKSFVSVVSFDLHCNKYNLKDGDIDNDDEEDDECHDIDEMNVEADDDDEDEDVTISQFEQDEATLQSSSARITRRALHDHDNLSLNALSDGNIKPGVPITSYRFGSVGQDTLLCFWELSDDLLKQPVKPKMNATNGIGSTMQDLNHQATTSNLGESSTTDSQVINTQESEPIAGSSNGISDKQTKSNTASTTSSSSGFSLSRGSKFAKTFSLNWRKNKHKKDKSGLSLDINSVRHTEDPTKLLGSPICPRMNEVPLLQPSICKKIAHERLTSLIFCKGGFVTSCQDGFLYSWARPQNRVTRRSTCCVPDKDSGH